MSATVAAEELAALTVREAGRLFRSAALSPVELTTAVLERLARTEPVLHAYVEVLTEDALAAARRAEAELRAGEDRGPLHGIPIGVKDIFDIGGLPTRCGSRAREGCQPAVTDAAAVAALRRAGAVFIGKTVTQEFAAGVVSDPARNPWDPARIPGGSSGGSAAAVAAGSCLAALGSDTGGSIRIPAAAVGVVGLKPTYGRVSKRGVYPLAWSLDTVGPLARTVEDAALVLNSVAGRDLADPTTADVPVTDAAAEIGSDVRSLRLGVPRPFFFDRLQAGVRTAIRASLGIFADLGVEVVETPWPDAVSARAAAFIINRLESVAVHRDTLRAVPHLLGPELRGRLEAGSLLPAGDYLQALRARAAAKRSVARLFAAHRLDALAIPTLPGTAVSAERLVVAHDDVSEEAVGTGYTRLTMPFNATGQPVLALPCGFDAAGLPVGLQLAGRPFMEAALCRLGHAFEQAAGWHRHRPSL